MERNHIADFLRALRLDTGTTFDKPDFDPKKTVMTQTQPISGKQVSLPRGAEKTVSVAQAL